MPIVVVPYDPAWPARFEAIRARVAPALGDVALAIEHVGSTSVPGLAAKPVIDVDVVVASPDEVPVAIERLVSVGYAHRGDLDVTGREAFSAPAGSVAQHLYVCPQGVLPLRNHLALRHHLRTHPEAVAAYAALKLRLAADEADDIDAYIDGKTPLILTFLAAEGLSPDDLAAVARVNRVPLARPPD
jgi:GrpB-like predicted nucleotidyltransferase (UPF0157 family)